MSNYNCTMMKSTALPASVEANSGRRYIAVIATTEVTVQISNGTAFSLPIGSVWSPIPACGNDIVFTGTGILILG